MEPLTLSLDSVTIMQFGNPVLRDVCWKVRQGENWAILGPNGAGKSALAAALVGEAPCQGEIQYFFDGRHSDPRDRIAWVSFNLQRLFVAQPGGYYQSRWYPGREEATLTAREILALTASRQPGARRRMGEVIRCMSLARVLNRQALHLSTGEMRRVLIARTLLLKPQLLLLDEPFIGLDAPGRARLSAVLKRLMRRGQQILFFTARPGELPAGITHDLWLKDGAVAGTAAHGSAAGAQMAARVFAAVAQASSLRGRRRGRLEACALGMPVRDSAGEDAGAPRSRLEACATAEAIGLRNVSLVLGGQRVLKRINWRVRRGERWALTGPNGAGKTALLSLLTGDHPQSYAQDVRLFGRPREGQTLWEWKALFGFASPDIVLHYDALISTSDFVASGFFGTLGFYERCTPAQQLAVARRLKYFGLQQVAARPFRFLSDGQQRLALVARALIKRPRIVVLDEPCQGLDPAARQRVLNALDLACRGTRTTLVLVTHYLDEMPACMTHRLELRKGRVVRHARL